MSGIEVAGLVLGTIPLVISALEQSQQDVRDFGFVSAVALRLGLFEAKGVVDDVREHFIKGDGGLGQAMAFKDSYTPTFNMIGVAGAILAQIALTALSLPNLNDTHWTAMASFVVALVAGSLAVFCSCVLQSKMSGLHNAQAVRSWLTRPRKKHSLDLSWFNAFKLDLEGTMKSQGFSMNAQASDTASYTDLVTALSQANEFYNETNFRPSISAALILTAPSQLLNTALGALLVGFGIYFGFVYSAKLPAIGNDHSALAVLVVFIASTVYGLLLFYIPVILKLVATMFDEKMDHDLAGSITRLENAIRAAQVNETASVNKSLLSALNRIVSIQEELLLLQTDSHTSRESRSERFDI